MLGCFRTQIGGWPGMKRQLILKSPSGISPARNHFFPQICTTRQRPWLASLYALDEKTTIAAWVNRCSSFLSMSTCFATDI